MRRSIPSYMSRTTILAIAACTTLALTGCGDGGGSTGGSALKDEDSPLSQWFEAFSSEEDFSQEAVDAQMLKIEEQTAVCMQGEGFEYIPSENSGGMYIGPNSDDGEPEWGTKEWAAQYGYQAFTMYDQATEMGSDDQPEDPNEDYVNGMSETEQSAYYSALYGDQSDVDWEDEDFDYNSLTPEQKGCSGRAQDEVGFTPQDSFFNSEEMQTLQDELNDFYESLENNDGMKDANAEWVTCMAKAGYGDKDWTKPQEPEAWFQEESSTMYDKATEDFDYENADENAEFPDPTASDEWKQMEKLEKDTAVADFTCRESSGWSQAQLKVQFAAEQEFIDAHKDQMDRLVEMYQEFKK